MSRLLRNEDNKQGLPTGEVEVKSMLFINAASETTATTLIGMFDHLVENPTSLSKLEHEVRHFSSLLDITLRDLKDLPCLNVFLKEALRMCSPT